MTTPDLMAVIDAMRKLRGDAKPSEVADYSGLSVDRAEEMLREAERQGFVRVGFWRLTGRGRELERSRRGEAR